jgi:hypothetical protein
MEHFLYIRVISSLVSFRWQAKCIEFKFLIFPCNESISIFILGRVKKLGGCMLPQTTESSCQYLPHSPLPSSSLFPTRQVLTFPSASLFDSSKLHLYYIWDSPFNFYNEYIDNVMDYKRIYNTLGVESDLKLGKIKTLKKQVYKVIVQCLMKY